MAGVEPETRLASDATRPTRHPLALYAARVILLLGLTVNLICMVAERGAPALPIEDALRIERIKDPTFLQDDLSATGLDYYGRAGWMQGLTWASRHVSTESLLLWLYGLELFVTLAGVYHLTLTLSDRDEVAAIVASALLAVYPHAYLLGQSAIYGRHFYEAWFAAGILCFALSYGIQRRPWPALAIAGLATNLHFLQGVQIAGLLGLFFAIDMWRTRPRPRRAWFVLCAAGALYLLLAAPELLGTLPAILARQAGDAAPVVSSDIVEIVGRLRYGHHFIPAQYEKTQYLGTAVVLWLGLAAAWTFERTPRRRAAALLIVLIVAVCTAVAPFIERDYVVMYLDVFRMMKFAWLLAIGLLATLLARMLRERAPLLVLPAAATLLLWHVPALCGLAALSLLLVAAYYFPPHRWKLVWSCVPLAVLLGLSLALLDRRSEIFHWRGTFGCDSLAIYAAWLGGAGLLVFLSRWIGGWRLLAAATLPVVASAALWWVLNPVSYATPHPQQALYEWIRTHTPADAVIVAPPTELADFRYQAHRTVFAEMWTGPLQPSNVPEWYERLNLLSRGELARRRAEIAAQRWVTGRLLLRRVLYENYRRLAGDELRTIGRQHGLRYCVMYSDVKLDLPVLYRDGRYSVLDLAGQTGAAARGK